VIELAHRYPGEGGVYLWAKEVFGDFHGFLSGWCYWTNNMMYVPTIMLYFVGVFVFVFGAGHESLADNKSFTLTASLILLLLLVVLNIVGLGVGKWVNNLGGIGTFVAATVLIGLGIVIWLRFGTSVTASDFLIPADRRFVLNSFGVICFGLVGLELASVMGDEIESPQKTLPGAVAWGGLLSGLLYVGATFTLLIAVRKSDISVLQGIVQAVGHMASRVGAGWIVAPFAFLLSISIAGIAFCVARRLGAHSFCCRPRFLHAGLAWQDSPEIRHAICGVGCSRCRFAGPGGDQFLSFRRRRARDVSEIAVPRRRAPTDPFPIHVWRADENRFQQFFREGSLRQDHVDPCWLQRIHDHWSGDCPGLFPGAAD